MSHQHPHAFEDYHPREREGLMVLNRRGMLKASVAGLAGLSLPELLKQRAGCPKRAVFGQPQIRDFIMDGGRSQSY